MSRIILRNLAVALGIALPVLLVSGALVSWLFPPTWAGAGSGPRPSLPGFLGGFVFWYVILALPALGIAALHQALLAALPHDWSPRVTRAVILGSALAIGAGIGGYVVATASEAHVAGIAGVLLPTAITYGLLVQPVRPMQASSRTSAEGGHHRAAG